MGGVHCHAPDGTHLGTIPIPERVSNVCFGGRKRNRLLITAQTSLYAIDVNPQGAVPGGARTGVPDGPVGSDGA
ncbi:SMP-30/gluconolactonase/LRE family protein [Xanthobacter dioxanivorans]|uniref:SMP-30/gluconolactonase/LRE family protein n=1 Tax=Xanthobacter dioxanivorans TaxID=2528964 RepID=UPI0038CD25CC